MSLLVGMTEQELAIYFAHWKGIHWTRKHPRIFATLVSATLSGLLWSSTELLTTNVNSTEAGLLIVAVLGFGIALGWLLAIFTHRNRRK